MRPLMNDHANRILKMKKKNELKITLAVFFALALLYALTHGFMANPLTVAGTAATSTPKAVLIR